MRALLFLSLVGTAALALVLYVLFSRQGMTGSGALAILIVAAIAALAAYLYTRPLDRATRFASTVARGAPVGRLPETAAGRVGDLYRALNRVAELHRMREEAAEAEKAETEAILRGMGEGVLAISPAGTVLRANPRLESIVGASGPIRGRSLAAIFRNPQLIRFLTPGSVPAEGNQGEFEVFGRTMLVTARQLSTGGVVAVLSDLSLVRRLNMVRTDFVANASHELKTPLTAIRGFAETLADPRVSEEKRHQFAERIVDHTRRMAAIVEDLLTLARLEEPSRTIRREPVPLMPTLEQIHANIEPRLLAEGIRLEAEIVPESLAVLGDPEGVRQVLENLIDNSIRHAAARRIDLRASRTGDGQVRVTVADDGQGIASAHIERIFERFYRVDPSRSRATGGTGLGLSIVKHWVEQMGGHVKADSTVGEGTRIHVLLTEAGGGG
jgi:two-component system phosphate regulon sensor histidine kinase PhoR